MARIKLNPFINNIAGKVGGVIFQNSQSGITLRNKACKCKPVSEISSIVNNIEFIIQQEWKLLTNDEKLIWSSYVKFLKLSQNNNIERFINNHQAFLKVNHYRLLYSLSILSVPQLFKCDIDPFSAKLYRLGNRLHLVTDRIFDSSSEFIILQCSYMASAGVNSPYINCKCIKLVTTDDYIFDITDEWLANFGLLPSINSTVFLRYSAMHLLNGKLLPFINEKCIIDIEYLFDFLSAPPLVFYSFFLVNSAYSGYCINLYNTYLGTYQDIGFVNGFVDYAAASLFLNGREGRIAIWYDQSGNVNNLYQFTISLMPVFVLSGSAYFNRYNFLFLTSTLIFESHLPYSFYFYNDWPRTNNSTLFGNTVVSGLVSKFYATGLLYRLTGYTGTISSWSGFTEGSARSSIVTQDGGVILNLELFIDNISKNAYNKPTTDFRLMLIGGNDDVPSIGFLGNIYQLSFFDFEITSDDRYYLNAHI